MVKSFWLSAVGILLSLSSAFATPAQIIMIRHGEKPNDDVIHLSKRGKQRAEALVGFFLKTKRFRDYGDPVALYAMKPKDKGSIRSIETLEPLSQKIGVPINMEFSRDEYEAAAKEILTSRKYNGKLVIICWEHDAMNNFADELGVNGAPKWKDDYDRAWILDYEHGEIAWFTDMPQELLAGDSDY